MIINECGPIPATNNSHDKKIFWKAISSMLSCLNHGLCWEIWGWGGSTGSVAFLFSFDELMSY